MAPAYPPRTVPSHPYQFLLYRQKVLFVFPAFQPIDTPGLDQCEYELKVVHGSFSFRGHRSKTRKLVLKRWDDPGDTPGGP